MEPFMDMFTVSFIPGIGGGGGCGMEPFMEPLPSLYGSGGPVKFVPFPPNHSVIVSLHRGVPPIDSNCAVQFREPFDAKTRKVSHSSYPLSTSRTAELQVDSMSVPVALPVTFDEVFVKSSLRALALA